MPVNTYEVVLSSKITGRMSTEIINAKSLEEAHEKAIKKFDSRYLIYDVHERG